MGAYRSLIARFSALVAVAGCVLVGAAQVGQAPVPLPLEPVRDAGLSVTPAFEGWYPNRDGTSTILMGYMNRNRTQVLDIPIGPNNRIEPGGPDYGQPTHFLPRRQWGLVAIVVPKDFATKRLTWTIVTNGETNSIPVWLNPKYVIEPFRAVANGDTPPVIRFEPNGRPFQGPPIGIAQTLTADVNQPLPLTVWVTDKGPETAEEEPPATAGRGGEQRPRVTVRWLLNRGADAVKFDPPEPKIDEKDGGKATTTATFSKPGEYGIRAQVNDITGDGGGGNQCCWTNAFVKVTVRP